MWLEFDTAAQQVTAEGHSVGLLPKEYALLEFLYRHKGRHFTREQLLDQVWPMEYPVERTVDDHIYRLRRKLAPFSGLDIRTIRGIGYMLVMEEDPGKADLAPAAKDPVMQQAMREVFSQFHRYGQGRSLLSLARQQEMLGFEMDPHFAVVAHFVSGDMEWLLHTEETPLQDRLFYLMLFYIYTGNPVERLDFCRQVLSKQILPPDMHTEVEILTIADLYILAGQYEKAQQRLAETELFLAHHPDYESFRPYMEICRMLAQLADGADDSVIGQLADTLENDILVRQPFLRENGSYRVIKGIWRMKQHNWVEMERNLEEGLELLEKTGFVPMLIHALQRIVHFASYFNAREKDRIKYQAYYREQLGRIGGERMLTELERTLQKAVNLP